MAAIRAATTYYIQNENSKLYVGVADTNEGSQLIQDHIPASGSKLAFQWGVLFTDEADGELRLFNALTGRAADAQGNQQPPEPNTAVVQFGWLQQGNQVWEPTTLNEYEFGHIRSSYDKNIVWDVDGGSTDPGAKLILFGVKNGEDTNQRFQFEPVNQPLQDARRVGVTALAGEPVAAGQG